MTESDAIPVPTESPEDISKMYIKLLVKLNREKAKVHKLKQERLDLIPMHRSILWSVVMMLDRGNVKGAQETVKDLLKPL